MEANPTSRPAEWPYVWRVRARLPERHGQACRVITRGKRNSCLVQFTDGACYVTSRNYLRKSPLPVYTV